MITQEELKYALIGAVVSVVTSFTGVGPIIGGAVASYLHGRDGPRVGALSGVVSMVPFLMLGLPVVLVLGWFLGIGPEFFSVGLLVAVFLALGVAFALAITVVLGAFGGWIGIVVLEDTGFGRSRTGESGSGER